MYASVIGAWPFPTLATVTSQDFNRDPFPIHSLTKHVIFLKVIVIGHRGTTSCTILDPMRMRKPQTLGSPRASRQVAGGNFLNDDVSSYATNVNIFQY